MIARRLRSSFGGRLSIWWWTHRRERRTALLLSSLFVISLTVAEFERRDFARDAELARAQAISLERQVAIADSLPPTVFIIEAKTPDEAQAKLDRVIGDSYAYRYQLTYGGRK